MAVELTPNWAPLERMLAPELCGEFMWMYSEAGIEHYKHIVTRHYLRLDHGGRCLVVTSEGLMEVPFEQEWKRVTGRTGRIGGDSADRTGWHENKPSEIECPQKGFEASRRAEATQRGDGNPIFCRPARRRRRQAHAGTGSGKRTGGPRDRV